MQILKRPTARDDANLIRQLTRRDGVLPLRPRPHRSGDAPCRYADLYPRGNCPWCRQAAGVIEMARFVHYPTLDLEKPARKERVA